MLAQRRILASTVLALILGAPTGAMAQGAGKLAATFNDRYPTEQMPTRPPVEQAPTQPPAEPIPTNHLPNRGHHSPLPSRRGANHLRHKRQCRGHRGAPLRGHIGSRKPRMPSTQRA